MTKFDIDSFALDLMRKVWEIGNRHGPDSQRKAQMQEAIAEAVRQLITKQVGEPVDDVVSDALDNLIHDNYELSWNGGKAREADANLIRAALANRKQPAPGGSDE